MKPIKILALVALTVLTALALVGVSPAMAKTQLCSADESPCEGNMISHVHETTLEGAKATLLNSLGNVECDALF